MFCLDLFSHLQLLRVQSPWPLQFVQCIILGVAQTSAQLCQELSHSQLPAWDALLKMYYPIKLLIHRTAVQLGKISIKLIVFLFTFRRLQIYSSPSMSIHGDDTFPRNCICKFQFRIRSSATLYVNSKINHSTNFY